MRTKALLTLSSLLFVAAGAAGAAEVVPAGFAVEILAQGLNQPKGIVSALHRAGAGPFGHDLYVAESGTSRILTVDKDGAGAAPFAGVGTFPVGVAFSGGPFGNRLYVGNAFGGGIDAVDPAGNVAPFALAGVDVSGLDFGHGDYGNDLFAGLWTAGEIDRVDPGGIATLFAVNPGTQTRYLKFSHGGAFGTLLYYTDFLTGDIYQVLPDGTPILFASTASDCLEGFDFGPGGAFGHYLYVGDVCTGDIFRVSPLGDVELWGEGFDKAADIHFEPGDAGGFTMYVASGRDKVYAVFRDK